MDNNALNKWMNTDLPLCILIHLFPPKNPLHFTIVSLLTCKLLSNFRLLCNLRSLFCDSRRNIKVYLVFRCVFLLSFWLLVSLFSSDFLVWVLFSWTNLLQEITMREIIGGNVSRFFWGEDARFGASPEPGVCMWLLGDCTWRFFFSLVFHIW